MAENSKYNKQLKSCATQLIKASNHMFRYKIEPTSEDAVAFLGELEVLENILGAVKTDVQKEISILTIKDKK